MSLMERSIRQAVLRKKTEGWKSHTGGEWLSWMRMEGLEPQVRRICKFLEGTVEYLTYGPRSIFGI